MSARRPSRRTLIATLAGVGTSVALPAVAAALPDMLPDTAILRLGRDLDQAVAHLRAQTGTDSDEPGDRCFDLCHQIEAASAVTLEGIRVKARAFSFYYADMHDGMGADPLGSDTFHGFDQPCSDVRMVLSILDALLAGTGYNEPARDGAVPVLGTILTPDAADPAFAAVERHRAGEAEYNRHPDDDEVRDARLMAERDGASATLVATVPTTGAGLRTMVEYLDAYVGETGGYLIGDTDTLGRAFPSIVAACRALFPIGGAA